MTEENAYKIMLEEFKLKGNDITKDIFHRGWFMSEQNTKLSVLKLSKLPYINKEAAFNRICEDIDNLDDNPMAQAIFNSAWKIAEKNTHIGISAVV